MDVCVCVKGATFTVEGGQSKGQRGSALLRSPLFPPPLRNSPCTVSSSTYCSLGLSFLSHIQNKPRANVTNYQQLL